VGPRWLKKYSHQVERSYVFVVGFVVVVGGDDIVSFPDVDEHAARDEEGGEILTHFLSCLLMLPINSLAWSIVLSGLFLLALAVDETADDTDSPTSSILFRFESRTQSLVRAWPVGMVLLFLLRDYASV
jgi:hypothetical protein